MFERFESDARQIVIDAQVHARDDKLHYINSEQLLLGCLGDSITTARIALEFHGFTLDAARSTDAYKDSVKGTADRRAPSGHIPFTPRAKKVLELALREALACGDNYIGSAHVLLGILRVSDETDTATQMLEQSGIVLEQLRQTIFTHHWEADAERKAAILATTKEVAKPVARPGYEYQLVKANEANKWGEVGYRVVSGISVEQADGRYFLMERLIE